LGIQEYWIVNYLGLGGRRYIGSPKQPTLTVCTLLEGEYELQQFRGDDAIHSSVLPNFAWTVNQIFNPNDA
jgi:Uma2 family endonuclease